MQATRLMRIPFFATGVKVTEDNMSEIAIWCEGTVIRETAVPFVRVPVNRSTHKRQTEGHIGTWVIRTILRNEPSFKVYDEEWLLKQFMRMDDECLDGLDVVEVEVADEELSKVETQDHCCCKHKLPDAHPVPVQNNVTPATMRRAS